MKLLTAGARKTIVLTASVFVILLVSLAKSFNNFELFTYDLRFKLRHAQKISNEIVIIEISDDTLKNLATWPLPRDYHATMVEVLKFCGAKAVVFDIIFSEPTALDEDFSAAIKNAGMVYLPIVFESGARQEKILTLKDNAAPLVDILKTFSVYAGGTGHINVSMDRDGKIRTVPLFIRSNNRLIPQLGFKVACDSLGLDTQNAAFLKNKIIIGNSLVIPVQEGNLLPVNYPGKWASSFTHYSYFEILKAYARKIEGEAPALDLSRLKDKICFIGLTATGTSDFQPIPLENNYPLVGLQASVANSILTRSFIKPAGPLVNIIIALILFAWSFLIGIKSAPLKALMGTAALSAAYFILACALFVFGGFWIDLFLPLAVISLVYLSLTAYRVLQETKRRQLLEQELEIAHAIQKSFLPQELKEFRGLNIDSLMLPAKFVAGDLYDFTIIDENKVGIFIGDVSGKGVPASLIMAQAISFFRIFSRQHQDPALVLSRLNKELSGKTSFRFLTCIYLVIDTVDFQVTVSSAAHAPVYVFRQETGSIEEVELNAGLPLWVSEETDYEKIHFSLKEKDKIILFTDGLFEARNKRNQEFGTQAIKDVLMETGTKKASLILETMINRVNRFSQGHAQHDDITLIVAGR